MTPVETKFTRSMNQNGMNLKEQEQERGSLNFLREIR